MKYHNITHDDMLNGDGIRVVLWVSGCEHGCKSCHNKITWDINSGLDFDQNAKNEIFDDLQKDYIKGITFSGGDPLHTKNRDEILNILKEIKQKFPQKDVWLYTGYTWEKIKHLDIVNYVDILVDGKFEQDLYNPDLHWKGSSNQRVIDVKKTLKNNQIVIHC